MLSLPTLNLHRSSHRPSMQVQTKNDLHVTNVSDNESQSDVDESNVVQTSPKSKDLTPLMHPFQKTPSRPESQVDGPKLEVKTQTDTRK